MGRVLFNICLWNDEKSGAVEVVIKWLIVYGCIMMQTVVQRFSIGLEVCCSTVTESIFHPNYESYNNPILENFNLCFLYVFGCRLFSMRTGTSRVGPMSAAVTALTSTCTWTAATPAGWTAGASWCTTVTTTWVIRPSWREGSTQIFSAWGAWWAWWAWQWWIAFAPVAWSPW